VGAYIPTRSNILNTLDNIANTVGAFYGFDRSGKLSVGQVAAPSGTADLELDSTNIIELERLPTEIPTSTVVVKYKKNHTVFDEDALDSGASDPDFFQREGASVVATDAAVAAIYPNAKFLELDSAFAASAGASAEATRLLNLYKVQRDIYRIRCKAQPFTLKLGDIVKVTFSRYSLNSGKLFSVVSLFEDAAVNEVELELWG
jgi:hypothetical protein